MTIFDLLPILHRGGSFGYWWTTQGKRSRWWPVGEPSAIPWEDTDIYFGVHPSKVQKSERERVTIPDIAAINCLFAEFDAKDFKSGKPATLEHINALPLSPSVIISSGGGYHCYWLFEEPLIISSQKDRTRAQIAQARWVALVGGDLGAKDLARVLRVPGTKNFKYTPPCVVEILEVNLERRYRIEDLEELVKSQGSNEKETRATARDTEKTPGGKRNSRLTSLAGAMRRRGMSGEAILAGLLAENAARCDPPLSQKEVEGIAQSVARYESNSGKGKSAGEAEEKKSQRDQLVDLVLEARADLFQTPEGEIFARIPVGNHSECWPIKSNGFKRWLVGLFLDTMRRSPGAQGMADALNTLEAIAWKRDIRVVALRVGKSSNRIYLDLADEAWRAVEISPNWWRIVENPPVLFRRATGMLPLPEPRRGGEIEELRSFLNAGDEDVWTLLLAWLTAAFSSEGPYPVLGLHGEQGSAKSTTAKVLRDLVDPSQSPLRTEPKEARDLAISAKNSWLIALDNLSGLPIWLSDFLCRLSTGGGFSTRRLYSDDEEIIFSACRPVILTGIAETATRSDLVDRSLLLTLRAIPEKMRRNERDFWQAFKEARPGILGAILDRVAGALRELPDTKLDRLPRMADFAIWSVAAERGAREPARFMATYTRNREESHEAILEASPVAHHLLALLEEEKSHWEGTWSELLDRLETLTDEKVTRRRDWPKNGRSLSGSLRRLGPNLRAVGIEWELRREGKGRARVVSFSYQEKVGIFASAPSANAAQVDVEPLLADAKPSQADAGFSKNGRGFTGKADAADAADAKIPHLSHNERRTCFCPECGRHVSMVEASEHPGWLQTECPHGRYVRENDRAIMRGLDRREAER